MTDDSGSVVDTFRSMAVSFNKFRQVIRKLQAPLPISTYEISFGDLKLDQLTGRCWYKGKEYRLRQGSLSFAIINLLILKNGKTVSYDEFYQAVKAVRGEKFKISRNMISSAVRELRRRFNINSRTNPQDDVFIATGTGFMLATR